MLYSLLVIVLVKESVSLKSRPTLLCFFSNLRLPTEFSSRPLKFTTFGNPTIVLFFCFTISLFLKLYNFTSFKTLTLTVNKNVLCA